MMIFYQLDVQGLTGSIEFGNDGQRKKFELDVVKYSHEHGKVQKVCLFCHKSINA